MLKSLPLAKRRKKELSVRRARRENIPEREMIERIKRTLSLEGETVMMMVNQLSSRKMMA
jgi:hypothetical protein